MTAIAGRPKASPVIWIVLFVVAAGVILVAFLGQDDKELGGRADPNGFGREGIAALRVMIERTGGVTTDVSVPADGHDVTILPTMSYEIAVAFGADEDAVYGPILDWVEAGGTLVTATEVPGGPNSSFVPNTETEITTGDCDIASLIDLSMIATAEGYAPVEIEAGDASCFGDNDDAVVVSRPLGTGSIIRVASFEPFFNQVLDELDNGALAARVIGMRPGRRVAFLSGPPASVGLDGPVDDDGNPIGIGDQSLLDLVPRRVLAMILGLAGASFLYALARGRRLGSPVEEPLPIELPSSSYTDAVGRLYSRAADPRARSAEILRRDFRSMAARRVGLAADAPTRDLAEALRLTTGIPTNDMIDVLDGPAPVNDDQLVNLARILADHRTRLRRGATAVRERTHQ